MGAGSTRVAIVGGGFSGAMLAARLAEQGVASTLINRTPEFGLGVAYGTAFDGHLLNVRSGRMSAVEGRPGDFLDWLGRRHPDLADADGFAPRRLYGGYVADRLAETEAARPGLIERRVDEAEALEPGGVRLAGGGTVRASAIVLATGNPAPRTARGGGRVIGDPWAAAALDRVGPADDVAILGSGLTMVDMLLALDGQGWRGRAVALSRRGLRPRAHGLRPDPPREPLPGMIEGALSQRLAAARTAAGEAGWRSMMEGLRPVTAGLWRAAEPEVRGRMVRHLRPWWDVHRHRIAPSVAAVLDRMTDEGRLSIVAGRAVRIEESSSGVALCWSPRGGGRETAQSAAWLIDCTGPGHDPAGDPLVGPLLAAGRARLDPLGLGLELDPAGRVLDVDGRPDPGLFVLGPPARAAFWETVAVPDIRKRIETLAAVLADPA